jgi:glutathione S-transferase
MITLYTAIGACSNFPHLVLEALQIPYELKIVKWGGTPELWKELEEINPMKQVPTLKTAEGYILTECPAIALYLSDKKAGALVPKSGEAKYRTFQWLNFISTEIHKTLGSFFSPQKYVSDQAAQGDFLKKGSERFNKILQVAEERLSPSGYCVGSEITLPDYYLATVLAWTKMLKYDMTAYPKLTAHMQKIWSTPEGQKVKSPS